MELLHFFHVECWRIFEFLNFWTMYLYRTVRTSNWPRLYTTVVVRPDFVVGRTKYRTQNKKIRQSTKMGDKSENLRYRFCHFYLSRDKMFIKYPKKGRYEDFVALLGTTVQCVQCVLYLNSLSKFLECLDFKEKN